MYNNIFFIYYRKEPCREAWRRSWGSAASGGSVGDDLWPLLQHHYEYIMDNQIIDSCKVCLRNIDIVLFCYFNAGFRSSEIIFFVKMNLYVLQSDKIAMSYMYVFGVKYELFLYTFVNVEFQSCASEIIFYCDIQVISFLIICCMRIIHQNTMNVSYFKPLAISYSLKKNF